MLCGTADDGPVETLQRPQRGLHRIVWTEPDEIEFQLGHGDWISLLRANGFEIEELHELYAPESAVDHEYYHSNAEWSQEVAERRDMARPPAPPLILASTSPQRRAILEQLRIPFDVVAPDYEEEPGVDPVEHARAKARSVAAAAGDRPVLGVDTEVLCDGRLFGKPRDEADAAEMLNALVGAHARGRVRVCAC